MDLHLLRQLSCSVSVKSVAPVLKPLYRISSRATSLHKRGGVYLQSEDCLLKRIRHLCPLFWYSLSLFLSLLSSQSLPSSGVVAITSSHVDCQCSNQRTGFLDLVVKVNQFPLFFLISTGSWTVDFMISSLLIS